jgi:hypothetical protein
LFVPCRRCAAFSLSLLRWVVPSVRSCCSSHLQPSTAHAPNSKRNVLIPIGISAAFYAGCMWYAPQVTVSRQNGRKQMGAPRFVCRDLEARPELRDAIRQLLDLA